MLAHSEQATVAFETLLAEAKAATGLADFGPSQEFGRGLRVLMAATDEAQLAQEHKAALRAGWIAALQQRLQLVDLRKRNPQIADEVIEGPLVVVGLPRTGTSALVDLLAQDPSARAPLQWETKNLMPPSSRETWATDSRADALEAQLQASAATDPVVKLGLHSFGARLPDECNSFLAMEFWSPNLSVTTLLPRYVEWLRLAQPRRPYLAHHWILQHLQAHGPGGRWTLKSPFHCFALAALVAEYPEAMLVQTHRNPAELIASNIGLICTIRGYGPGHPGRVATSREQLALWGTGMQRCLADRADPALDQRIMDISHRTVFGDPIGSLQSIYERFDLEFTKAAESRARAWLENPAQHKSSVRYTLADFDLTEADVEEAFGPYRERFAAYF
jgi:hypothetical protein